MNMTLFKTPRYLVLRTDDAMHHSAMRGMRN